MYNLIPIGEQVREENGREIRFKNFAQDSLASGGSISMLYLCGSYVMTLDYAFFFSDNPEEKEEQNDFINSVVTEEMFKYVEVEINGLVQSHHQFVTATIEKKGINEWVVFHESSISLRNIVETFENFEDAYSMSIISSYKFSKSLTSEQNHQIWLKE